MYGKKKNPAGGTRGSGRRMASLAGRSPVGEATARNRNADDVTWTQLLSLVPGPAGAGAVIARGRSVDAPMVCARLMTREIRFADVPSGTGWDTCGRQ
jgi:hypothetical protein